MKKSICASATALVLMSAQAMAAETGFYAGVGGGVFGVDADVDLDEEITSSFDEDDTGFRAFGGWNFTKNFAAELGYLDGGTANGTIGDIDVDGAEADIDLDASGVDLSFVGTLPLGDRFFVFGRAGLIAWDADLDAVITFDDGEGGTETEEISASDSGEDPLYGAGFGVNFGENAAVRVEYTFYDLGDVDGDFASASFVWKF